VISALPQLVIRAVLLKIGSRRFEFESYETRACKQGEILARGKRDDGQGEVVVPLLTETFLSQES